MRPAAIVDFRVPVRLSGEGETDRLPRGRSGGLSAKSDVEENRRAMKYMFLLYNEENDAYASPEAMADWWRFEQNLAESGIKRSGEALLPSATATTVSVRNGETIVTDGPFADTREQLGGYYVLDCADLDEAIAWAARVPLSVTGHIEVRPVVVFDQAAIGQAAG
jgi:hypothetical protein